DGAAALAELVRSLGARLLEVPAAANGRGLREVGCLPGIGPGLADAQAGKSADEIKEALESGELAGLILWECDPIRDLPDPAGWPGDETASDSAPEAPAAVADEVPFYDGLTHAALGGHGVRWQERDAAAGWPGPGASPTTRTVGPEAEGTPRAPADDADAIRL